MLRTAEAADAGQLAFSPFPFTSHLGAAGCPARIRGQPNRRGGQRRQPLPRRQAWRRMQSTLAIFANVLHFLVDLSVLLIDLGVGVALISGCWPADSSRWCGPLCVDGWRSR
jgi:hypothetical protein